MSKDVIKLPRPANPNIEQVLARFLEDRRKGLKPATMRKYESIVGLFTVSMNSYAYQCLDERESKAWNHFFDAEGPARREFCQIFGPEKIPENIGEFLGYFMPRKVICGRELLKSAGTVMKKLGKWLAGQGFIDDESAESVAERGATAAKNLPAADKVAEMIHHYTNSQPVSKWTDEVEGYFTVGKIEPGKLHLSNLIDLSDEIIILSVPRRISDSCKVGWDISLLLGKSCSGWKIIESGGVYAH